MEREVSVEMRTPMALAVREAYKRGEEDEALLPLVLVDGTGAPVGRFGKGDYVIFYDIRGEREVELTESLISDDFDAFPAVKGLGIDFVTMIEYDKKLAVKVAFPPLVELKDTLSETLSRAGKRQVKIVESEKSIHLGFFLNGKRKDAFSGEERLVVPSAKDVAMFDEKPEMSVVEVSEEVRRALANPAYDAIIANFANIDVVGHIENEEAIRTAVGAVDREFGRVVEAARANGVTVVVTADHGSAERWRYPDGAIDTGHTSSPVPFMVLGPAGGRYALRKKGALTDVAPTVLHVLGIPKPATMTGRSMIEVDPPPLVGGERGGGKRVLLLILDGWGYNEDTYGNLIKAAKTPVMDRLASENGLALLSASGTAVGMPEGTVGNSEAGHLHIGAGRTIYSDRLRIDRAIADGSYFENEAFLWAMREAKNREKNLHMLGIVSFYSSHGSLDHLLALMDMAKREGVERVFIHTMLGRRGERPESGARYIAKVEEECERLGLGEVVDCIGRYWSLDREENWDRVEKAYRLLVHGDGRKVPREGAGT